MEIPVKTKIERLPMKENSSGQNTDQNSKTPQLSLARRTFVKRIAALGAEAVARIVKTIAIFDDFCHANDPHQEHDFGSFEADGHSIFFKIDYYDKSLKYHSPDATDKSVTERVITVMLAEEY
jgi:hypothetical protein